MVSKSLSKIVAGFILLTVCYPFAFASEQDKKTIHFTTAFPKQTQSFKIYELLYGEAFSRIGFDFTMTYHPDERALIELNSGKYDGITGRIRELETEKSYPNLLLVNEVILNHKSIGLVTNPEILIDGWKSLKETGKKITYVTGNKYIERQIPKHVDQRHIIPASDISQALRMLLAGRVGIYIELDDIIVLVQLIEEFKNHRFYNAGPMDFISTFPYLHKKNRTLVPKLVETLRAMKADGTYSHLIKKVSDNEGI